MLKDGGFSPDEVAGPDAVTIRWAHAQFFTDPTIRARLKDIVTEAEALAHIQLILAHTAEGQAAAKAEETRRELDAIDWDDDSES
ncbi:MAG: hypothetical protein WA290_11060 [Mycobacterium sp.]